MGLAILPVRLEQEMKYTAEALCSPDPEAVLTADPSAAKHKDWALSVLHKRKVTKENAEQILKEEIMPLRGYWSMPASLNRQKKAERLSGGLSAIWASTGKAPSHKGRGFLSSASGDQAE